MRNALTEEEILSQRLSENQLNEKEKPKKKKPFLFPNQCQYLAYFVVVASAGSSALVTFFYSMMWGPKKSNEWLASMFTGFFQSILVIQPIKAVFVAILLAAIFRKPVKQESTEEEEEEREMKDELEKIRGDDGIVTADEIPVIR